MNESNYRNPIITLQGDFEQAPGFLRKLTSCLIILNPFFLKNISFFSGLFLGYLWASSALADSSSGVGSLFTASDNDISKNLLGYIFGRMEGVLTSGGSPLLGNMFSVFNSTVLAVGGIVIVYMLFVSTINTAHEGEVMGKNWSSIWIPFRSALGVALLLPKASGYSTMQIMIMWVVLQGIGAANSLWGVVVNYLNTQGSTTSVNIISPSMNSLITAQSNILQVVGCMEAINKSAGQPVIQQNPLPIIADSQDAKVTFGGDPNLTGGLDSALCGTITWSPKTNTEPQFAMAIQAMIEDAQLKSDQLLIEADNAEEITAAGTPNVGAATTLQDPATSYFEAVSNLGNASSTSQIISNDQLNQGWMLAGSYYYLLSQSNVLNGSANVPTVTVNAGSLTNQYYASQANQYMTYITKFVNTTLPTVLQGLAPDESLGISIDSSDTGQGTNGAVIGNALAPFQAPVANLSSNASSKAWVSQWLLNPNTDPIAQVQQMGASLINTVEAIWLVGGITLFGVTTILSVVPFDNPLAPSFLNLVAWIVPLLMSMLVFVFIGGAMLAYYVPMLPFLFFTFGALGWLMSVIEAIIAGPLVALGILHPEGHELYGEAKPAFMLLLNILLRPSLMIFGLITAVALSYATIAIINMGFANAVNGIYQNGGMLSLTSGIALIILYVSIVVAALTFTTQLITQTPNRVFRWIGGSVEGYGEAQAVGEAQKGFSEGMSGIGEGMGVFAEKSGKLGKSMAKPFGKAKDGSSEAQGGASQGNSEDGDDDDDDDDDDDKGTELNVGSDKKPGNDDNSSFRC